MLRSRKEYFLRFKNVKKQNFVWDNKTKHNEIFSLLTKIILYRKEKCSCDKKTCSKKHFVTITKILFQYVEFYCSEVFDLNLHLNMKIKN